MKKSGFFAASVAAASATPIILCNTSMRVSQREERDGERDNSSAQRSDSTDKFAPRFDGLKFIETLVTAHR